MLEKLFLQNWIAPVGIVVINSKHSHIRHNHHKNYT